MSQEIDLAFATTDELIGELEKRHTGLIVAGQLTIDGRYYVFRSGPPLILRGLLSVTKDNVAASVRKFESQ